MVVSGGQSPIRVASRSARVWDRTAVRSEGVVPLLKNGPLCLAVYGGRDLAGLPSADSHHTRVSTELQHIEKGAAVLASGIRESLFSLIRAGS
ncbi:hypothetical protein K0M31_009489 [Melipona bicolor]|uniref:Uncharacterized protein n=1 Tax=Melipona bicolor TaxID=60889 RepID=A0AA40FN65_9HYME|nr:hypothetical protein K0M31_009489 [Melipona bicolor]